ncbi:MAG: DUF6580 family putative transport protein [Planctomycetota bacterium]
MNDSPAARRHHHLVAAASLLLTAAASRLLPHPPNFTAVPAMALFAGAVLGRRWLAFVLPLAALLLSDLVLCATVYGFDALSQVPASYAAMAGVVCIGQRLGRSSAGVATGAVAATALFFVVTNLAVWAFAGFYPRDLSGLVACYTAALPFAASMLLSTLVYGFALLGVWRAAERLWPSLRLEARRTELH